MPQEQMKDRALKKEVKEVLENCKLQDLILDREVQINITGDTEETGALLAEKEIDVVAKFSYGGQQILLLFECEDSNSARGLKNNYKHYSEDIKAILDGRNKIQVIKSSDGTLKSQHLRDIDVIKACFVYGDSFPESAHQIAIREGVRRQFLVWNHLGLNYYRKVSAILGKWCQYELYRDLSLDLPITTFSIKAVEVRQKGIVMWIGRIHPGQLLQIGYVVRRASEKKHAYQRLLNKDRMDALARFISDDAPENFLPSTVLIVFDPDSKIRKFIKFDAEKSELALPMSYCSAWVIDGQHRLYGFLGTPFESWTIEKFKPFDLPVIIIKDLPEPVQTKTFININYNQKRIKAALLCDLAALTEDLHLRLTWASLIGRELNYSEKSPLQNRIKVSELHTGRPITLSGLILYGLLETLLGFRARTEDYNGPLFNFAPFEPSAPFKLDNNQRAFKKQVGLLIRFLQGVRSNTEKPDPKTSPWQDTAHYSLLKTTGLNALFMVLSKILQKYPNAELDFETFLKPLNSVKFNKDYVAKKGGGWKGFREFANTIIGKLNKGKRKNNKLTRYGRKEKV